MRFKASVLLLILSSYLLPTIITVPEDQPDIQSGINISVDGDTILVSPGIYNENINFSGRNITVGSLFLLSNDPNYIDNTVIDGIQLGSVVTFENGEDSSALLTGFTVMNGQTTYFGSGIYCMDSSPTLTSLKITDNHFSIWGAGGGMYFMNSSSSLLNIELINNSAQFGGGFYAENSVLSLLNISLINNQAFKGGGLCLLNSNASALNILLKNNYSSYEGGAVWCDRSELNLINSTIVGNSALAYGGGIYLIWSTYINLINGVFQNNDPADVCFTYDGYYPYSTMNVAFCNFAGGESGLVTNNNGYLNMLEGNIYSEPYFIGENDHHLNDDSPCIGAGTDEILISGTLYEAPIEDLEGFSRPLPAGSMPDIGAYENQYGEPQTSVGPNLISDQESVIFNLQNYPNPFNPETLISFHAKSSEIPVVKIYNHKGQEVRDLFPTNIENPEGEGLLLYRTVWDGKDNKGITVASGIYFSKVILGSYQRSRKLLLIK